MWICVDLREFREIRKIQKRRKSYEIEYNPSFFNHFTLYCDDGEINFLKGGMY